MFAGKMRLGVVAALVMPVVTARVHADYVSATVPLQSLDFGGTGAIVVAEANNGPGLGSGGALPGQVRLSFSVNPLPAYGQLGPHFGFSSVSFNTDLALSPSQIQIPPGWSMAAAPQSGVGGAAPSGLQTWQFSAATANYQVPSVGVLITGLGTQATLDHFLTPMTYNDPLAANPPPWIFQAVVGGFQAPGNNSGQVITSDALSGGIIQAAPEPSALTLGAVGLAGVALVRRRRVKSRR
jgi:MYXO-CTERM domain-containing protein